MIFSIIGNNDGPLLLYKSLQDKNMQLPVLIGLQKKPEAALYKRYQTELPDSILFIEFDEAKILERLEETNTEVLINCFCNFRFTDLLKKYRCINIHPSYLPTYRGRHPMHWALINGEAYHGITIHEMNERFDDGMILWQEKVKLQPHYSVLELRNLLMERLSLGFPEFMNKLHADTLKKIENQIKDGAYIRARKPDDSELTEWNDPDFLYRKIMALRSEKFPAYFQADSLKNVRILDAKLEKHSEDLKFDKDATSAFPRITDVFKEGFRIQTDAAHTLVVISPDTALITTDTKIKKI